MSLEYPEESVTFNDGYKSAYDSYFQEYNSSIHYIKSLFLSNVSGAIQLAGINLSPRDVIVVGTGPWWGINHLKEKGGEDSLSCLESWGAFPGGVEVAKAFIDTKVKRLLLEMDQTIPAGVQMIISVTRPEPFHKRNVRSIDGKKWLPAF